MKTLRPLLHLVLLILLSGTALADPFEIKVERKVVNKEDRINRQRLQAEEILTTLNLVITNRSGKPLAEGMVHWSVLVARGGAKKDFLISGKSKLAALANSQSATVETDAFTIVKNRDGKQSFEYKISLVDASEKELAQVISDPKFDAIASAAHPGNKETKKEVKKKEKGKDK